jgi:predicted DNA-binding protein
MQYSDEKRTERIVIRIESYYKELLEDLAEETGVSVSAYLRRIVINTTAEYWENKQATERIVEVER